MYTEYPYKLGLIWGVILLEIMLMQGLGFVISAGFKMEQGFVVGILAITFQFAMSGFFNKIQMWLSWILWANIFIPVLTLGGVVFWHGNTWICDDPSDFEHCPEHEITQQDVLVKFFPLYMPDWTYAFLYIIFGIVLFRVLSFRLLRVRMSKNIGQ